MFTYYYNGRGLAQFHNIVAISCTVMPHVRQIATTLDVPIRHYRALAPDWNTMVQPFRLGQINELEYTRRYWNKLYELNPYQVLEDLGDDAVLLCYEPSNKFCHRHLAAGWLRDHGIDIREYVYIEPTQSQFQLDFDW